MLIDKIELIIVGASALATSIFSYLIWKANIQSANAAQSAADAAIESARISKLMLEAEEEKKQSLRDQIKRDMLKQASNIAKTLDEIKKENISSSLMNKLPEEFVVTNYELASYFSVKERQLIYYTVKKYESFRSDYFKDGQPSYKVDEKLNQDIEDLLEKFKEIIIEFTEKIYITSNTKN